MSKKLRWWALFIKGYEARAVFNPSFETEERLAREGWTYVAELLTKSAAYDYAANFFAAVPGNIYVLPASRPA